VHEVRSSEFRRVCYRVNILGSQLSSGSISVVPAQSGKVTVGLASHWPCVRHRGLSTYGLNGQRQGDHHPRLCPFGAWHYLPYLCLTEYSRNINEDIFLKHSVFWPRAGCEVKRIDPLRFLDGCCKRRLNQALSVLSLSLSFFSECVCCAVN